MHENLFLQSVFILVQSMDGNEAVKGRHLYATPLLQEHCKTQAALLTDAHYRFPVK